MEARFTSTCSWGLASFLILHVVIAIEKLATTGNGGQASGHVSGTAERQVVASGTLGFVGWLESISSSKPLHHHLEQLICFSAVFR